MGFTPDNKEVIYTAFIIDESRGTVGAVWKSAGGHSIANEIPVLMAVDIGTKKTRVIREEAELGQYSPGGKYFAYINYDHRAVTDPPNAKHHYSLALYDSAAKETRYLTDGLGSRTRNFSFSGDESYIAAEVSDTTSVDYRYRIYRIPVNGGEPVDISWKDNPWGMKLFTNPAYSPDGRWIMYTAWINEKRMLFIYDTTTGKTGSVFPETAVWNTDAAWSPDGKTFCCQLEPGKGGKGALYRFDFKEADLGIRPELREVPLHIPPAYGKQLVNFSLDSISREDSARYAAYANLRTEYSPVWSPDGRSIAFTSLFSSSLWTVPAEGGMPSLVADYTNACDYKGYKLTIDRPNYIRYTPDGKSVMFGAQIIDESRGTVVTITEGTTPTGGRHFGYSISNSIQVLKAVDIGTGETRLVRDSAGSGVYSRNGRYLAYRVSPGGAISLYDIQTGETKALTSTVGQPLCFAPDDSYLLARIGSSGCYRIPLDGGPTETLFSGSCYSGDISRDGRLALYQGTVDGKTGLIVYEIQTGKQYPLITDGDGFTCREGSFSPDGKKVCYTLDYSGNDHWTRTYVRDFSPAEIGIATAAAESAPARFMLTGNYPNPFNPSTTIGFSLDSPGKVSLTVFSLSGQKVRDLVSGISMPPGAHEVVWNGRDESGKAVSSGVYFIRLTQGSRMATRKMAFMK
ncbi:MAG: TolB family protein, partial [Candidatus Latescibacterota bacterium]